MANGTQTPLASKQRRSPARAREGTTPRATWHVAPRSAAQFSCSQIPIPVGELGSGELELVNGGWGRARELAKYQKPKGGS
jgi:hypothetical protein